ncbi:MAG: hypothetical protein ACREJY_12225 [Candidatus Rokuibacteriota bacterium]
MRFGWLTLSHSPSAEADHLAIEEQLVQACLAEEVGFVHHLLCQMSFGYLGHERILASMRRFGAHVLPAFR